MKFSGWLLLATLLFINTHLPANSYAQHNVIRSETEGGPQYEVAIFQQDILQELPFSKGFIDSLWSPRDVKFIDAHTFVVADRSVKTVWLIQNDGMNIRSVGRSGDGPGEFQEPVRLAVDDNSFYVWDRRSYRISSFNQSGEFIETKSHHEIVISGIGARMCMAGWGEVAIASNHSQMDYFLFGTILLFPTSLEEHRVIQITRLESRVIEEDLSYTPAFNRVSIGKGIQKSLLVGYENDYTIRRYSDTGEILWESGPLDQNFKPIETEVAQMGGGNATLLTTYNGLTGIWEIEGWGILVGVRLRVGVIDDRTIYDTFLDVVTLTDGIIKRIPIPERLLVRDVWIGDEELRILAMLTGGGELPRFTFYKTTFDLLFN